jgi:hypothetical protein
LQKLINQISIGRVDFDPIESRFIGPMGSGNVVLNGGLNFFQSQCMGNFWFNILHVHSLLLSGHGNVGSRNGAIGSGVETGMSLTTLVPQLKEHLSALGMDTFDNLFPSSNVFVGVHGGGIAPSISLLANGSGFGYDQTSRSTLFVVLNLKLVDIATVRIKWIISGSSSVARK